MRYIYNDFYYRKMKKQLMQMQTLSRRLVNLRMKKILSWKKKDSREKLIISGSSMNLR